VSCRKKTQNSRQFIAVVAGFTGELIDVNAFRLIKEMVSDFGVGGHKQTRRFLRLEACWYAYM
jgi:hypothetical protein